MTEVVVKGIDDLVAALKAIPSKLRYRAVRNALAAGARIVRDVARRETPVISISNPMVQRGYRKPWTVRDAIVVRTSGVARRSGDVGVFVNVRPLKRGGGKYNPNDPFYWRWLEFGRKSRAVGERSTYMSRGKVRVIVHKGHATGAAEAQKFLQHAGKTLGEALQVIMPKLISSIEKLNVINAPPP